MGARTYYQLARWLGPWASEEKQPGKVIHRTVTIPGRTEEERDLEAWLMRPRGGRIRGTLILAHGLHYAGPADPRFERFTRILARAGFVVFAPFIPDYLTQVLKPQAIDDFERALEAFLEQPEVPDDARPGLFSISFGSLLALRLACSERWRDRVSGVITFGGYADFELTTHYCLTGEIPGHTARMPADPLNKPVVMMNLVQGMPEAPDQMEPVMAAWRRYVQATWGKPEVREGDRHLQIARDIGRDLPARQREFYLIGCGVEEGCVELCQRALDTLEEELRYLDPRPHLDRIRGPVYVTHGIDDDVIPHTQAQLLAEAIPEGVEVKRMITGLYGHTTSIGVRDLVGMAPALAREAWTMGRLLRALVRVAGRDD